MKAIKPTPITPALLVSTTATETYAEYNAATTYALNAIVTIAATQRMWQCIQGPSTGNAPASSPLYWTDIGPSNVGAMFDAEISTQTSATATLTVVIKPGYCNSLALYGLEGTELEVTGRDALAGAIVYGDDTLTGPRLINLDGTTLTDWYMYFFEPFVQLAEVALTDLPPYGDAHITITITGPSTVKCAQVVLGTFYELGDTQYGATAAIIDYSRKTTSAAGVTTFERRAYSKRVSLNMMLPNTKLNKVQRVLADLRATPCAWIGTDVAGYEPLTLYGFYRDFSIDVAYPTTSYCSLEIEGLA
jgi:hypothetical protein